MSRPLPSQPSLRHLKNEAKKLLKDLEQGDAEAAARISALLPRLTGAAAPAVRAAGVTLQEVQHVLAKEYGFPTWADLVAAMEPGGDSGDQLEPVVRPLEQLSIEEVRRICRGISRLVKAHGESVRTIGPGDFYRGLEALAHQASPSIGEFLGLAADGAEPEVIARLARNRGGTVARNLEIRRRVVLEGAVAIRQGERPALIGHHLDTICHAENDAPFRAPEGTVEQLRARLARTPASHLRHAELAMVVVDLAWIVQRRGADALGEVLDTLDEEYLRDAVQMVVDQVDAAEMAAALGRRMAAEVERARQPFAPFGAGLAAALEGEAGAELDAAVDAALAAGAGGGQQ
ncbi:MAG: hypothetical protein ABIL09_02975 [Gemmatimonadota bacterium]